MESASPVQGPKPRAKLSDIHCTVAVQAIQFHFQISHLRRLARPPTEASGSWSSWSRVYSSVVHGPGFDGFGPNRTEPFFEPVPIPRFRTLAQIFESTYF